MRKYSVLFSLLVLSVSSLYAQAVVDTLITWNSEGFTASKCRVQLYQADTLATRGKHHVVVIQELAENTGSTTVADARFLATHISEILEIDVENTLFIHYFGAFSFPEGKGKKILLLRATFSQQENGRLSTPTWRPVTVDEVLEYTDRLFRRD